MGPPPFGDGKDVPTTTVTVYPLVLQWGYSPFGDGKRSRPRCPEECATGFNGATAFRRWKSRAGVAYVRRSIDTGFNGATAFRRWKAGRRGTGASAQKGFNGATAFRRWKGCVPAPTIGNCAPMLQWGHRLSAMERSCCPPTGRRPVPSFGGATAFRRWKVLVVLARSAQSNTASMGPPPFGDGKRVATLIWPKPSTSLQWGHRLSAMERGYGQHRPDIHHRASMGPPPFGDGKFTGFTRSPFITDCFNGATAFRRWKAVLPRCAKPSRSCFNGATAFRRWKVCRGTAPSCPRQGFNGATAFRRWKAPGRTRRLRGVLSLQWGHRLSAMESAVRTVQPATLPLIHASMGPPPFGDGKIAVVVFHAVSAIASMGPPPFGDGKIMLAKCAESLGIRLQWGHRLSAMESSVKTADRSGWLSLQWGHRLSAMESRLPPAVPCVKGSLQWGHRLSAMERIPASMCGLPAAGGFNGATAFRRWKGLFANLFRRILMLKCEFPQETIDKLAGRTGWLDSVSPCSS